MSTTRASTEFEQGQLRMSRSGFADFAAWRCLLYHAGRPALRYLLEPACNFVAKRLRGSRTGGNFRFMTHRLSAALWYLFSLFGVLCAMAGRSAPAADAVTPDDWPCYGHDAGGMRFSPLTQI